MDLDFDVEFTPGFLTFQVENLMQSWVFPTLNQGNTNRSNKLDVKSFLDMENTYLLNGALNLYSIMSN